MCPCCCLFHQTEQCNLTSVWPEYMSHINISICCNHEAGVLVPVLYLLIYLSESSPSLFSVGLFSHLSLSASERLWCVQRRTRTCTRAHKRCDYTQPLPCCSEVSAQSNHSGGKGRLPRHNPNTAGRWHLFLACVSRLKVKLPHSSGPSTHRSYFCSALRYERFRVSSFALL